MKDKFAEEIAGKVAAAAGVEAADVLSQLTSPPNPAMGDYAYPCFIIAKRDKRNPKPLDAGAFATPRTRRRTSRRNSRPAR